MTKSRWYLLLAGGIVLSFVLVACKKEKAGEKKEGEKTETKAPASAMDQLCEKLVTEAGPAATEETNKSCLQLKTIYGSKPNFEKVSTDFANKINELCKDKTGQDFVTCYNDNNAQAWADVSGSL